MNTIQGKKLRITGSSMTTNSLPLLSNSQALNAIHNTNSHKPNITTATVTMQLSTILVTLFGASALALAVSDPAQTTEPVTLEKRQRTVYTTINYVVNTNEGLANGNKINPVTTVHNIVEIIEPAAATYTGVPTHTGHIIG